MDSDQKDEKELKRILINENILDRGYNLEDFENFISRTRGVEIDAIPYNSLKTSVNRFIIEKLDSTFSNYDFKKKVEEEKSTVFEFLYSPSEYKIKTPKQYESQLVTFEKNKMPIHIQVSSPITEKSNSFFKGDTFSVLIECKELNISTRKSIADIEWFQNKMAELYPYDLIAPLKDFYYCPKNDLDIRVRYLQKFFDLICRKKVHRTSSLLYNFLTLSDELFKRYKTEIQKTNLTIKPDYSNFVTCKGEMKIEITPEKAILANSISAYIAPTLNLLTKLINTLQNISVDFENVSKHMKEASELFLTLGTDVQKFKYKTNSTIAYAHWNLEFSKSSANYIKMSKVFNEEIKEKFDFLKLEISQLTPLYQRFEVKRDAFENYGSKLKSKKEQLFESKKYSKWETEPNKFYDFQELQNDKKKSFQIMCYKDNLELEEYKKHASVVIHKIVDQFEKVFKYQEEQISDFGKGFYENNKKLAEQEMNIIKLFIPKFA